MKRGALAGKVWLLLGCGLMGGCNDSSDAHAGHTEVAPSAPVPAAEDHASHRPDSGSHGAEAASQGSRGAPAHGHLPAAASVPSGYADFSLEPAQAADVGLKSERVTEQSFERALRTTGVVALDETRTSHVHTKVRGWVENVSADFIGKKVKAGAPLCTIYSQEVLAAELEYLSILEQTKGRPPITGNLAAAEQQASQQLLAAARRRLALWDVPESEIARLETTRTPRRTFTLVAPRSGIVVAKQALPGMFIDPSAELYVISDTSQLWVLSDIYERDVPFVKVGDSATLRIEGLGAHELDAKVAFIPPTVDEATRTLRVRFELSNRDSRVRPGAFVTVELKLQLGKALAVPESAVIHAGKQDIVFVLHGTHVQPRAVVTGPLVGDRFPVHEGLSAGEMVAVGAQFLIDSESRLRATSRPGGAHAGH
jgi:Cu(I)/Ag(I) efflux system membrane fusion protein